MIAIGVDVGLSGALAVITAPGVVEVRDLEAIVVSTSERRVVTRHLDPRHLWQTLRELVPGEADAVACLEDIRAMPGKGDSGSAGASSLMHSRATCETVLRLQGITPQAVDPRTWQRSFGYLPHWTRTTRKARARELAAKLYPAAAGLFSRVKDADRADAVLLAHYALKNL